MYESVCGVFGICYIASTAFRRSSFSVSLSLSLCVSLSLSLSPFLFLSPSLFLPVRERVCLRVCGCDFFDN